MKAPYWKDRTFYTDYPLVFDKDGEPVHGIIYEVKVLSFDGNKYATVKHDTLGEHEVKLGYIHPDIELQRRIPWRVVKQMEGLSLKHLKRRFSKTTYEVAHSETIVTVNTKREAFHLLNVVRGTVSIWRNIEKQGHYGMYSSKILGEYEALVPVRTYEKATKLGKPGPRVRAFIMATGEPFKG